MKSPVDRRQFLATATATGAALTLARTAAAKETPALLGGTPVRREPFPGWPRVDDRDEKDLLEVLRSGNWYRGAGDVVNQFESAYAELTGAKHCVADGQRDLLPHHLPRRARGRAGRRGDRAAVHVHRDRQRGAAAVTPCPSSSTPTPRPSRSTPARSRPPSPTGPWPSCRCTSAARSPTWTRSSRSPGSTSSPSSRMPASPTSPSGAAEGGHLGLRRLLQLPEQQEPDLRRGGRHPHQRRRAGRALLHVPEQHRRPAGRRATTSPTSAAGAPTSG